MDSYISSAKLPLALTCGVQSKSEMNICSGEHGKTKADENGSRVDQDAQRQKPYHRHTPQQIQEMEAIFKECPYPDHKKREELSKKLQLAPRQIKCWFQNRRNQMKVQQERHHNAALRNDNERLRREKRSLREAMTNSTCYKCGRSVMQQLRSENTRLKNEIARLTAITRKMCGRPFPHMASISRLQNASLGVAAISAAPKSYCDYGKTGRETIPTNDTTFSESDSC